MITIDKSHAQIGINQSHATLRIQSNRLRMRVTQDTPQLQVQDTDVPRFQVANRARLNTEMGLSPPAEFINGKANDGRAGALRGTRRAANDGEFLGNVRDLTNGVPRLARMRQLEAVRQKTDFNVGLMPQSMPEFSWDQSQMRVNWSNATLIIDWDGDHMPTINLESPHSVEVYLSSRPYFRVRVEEALPQSGFEALG